MTNQHIPIDSTLLNSLLAHVAIIEKSGTLLKVNDAWKQFDDANIEIKRPPVGENYLETLQQAIEFGNDYALKLLIGLNKVLQGSRESFSLTYPVKNNSFWFKMTVRPCNDEHTQFMITHEDITSTMKARYDRIKNEDRYQIKFQQSPDGIFVTDANGTIIDANPAATNILGWSTKEFKSRTLDNFLDVNDPAYKNALKERQKHGTFELEMDLAHKNCTTVPAEVSSRAYRNPQGKLRAIITFRDISRRKQAEQSLIKTKQFTESALNSIPGIFFVLDREGNLVRWNENMVTNLGYSAEELSQKNALDFVLEEEKSKVNEKIEECIKTGELSVEVKMHSKDDKQKDYFILAKRFVEEGRVYLVGAGIDITENRKIERENQKNQIMMEQLFANAPVGIAIVDTDNKVQHINNSFEQMFNYTKEEVLQKNINDLLAPDTKKDEAEQISEATRRGQSLQKETVRITKNGQEIPVLIGSVPVELQGEIIAIYGIYVDISQQREYRYKIEEALREKETLLAELHHRVKNNLALINSLLELQLFDVDDNSELEEELTDIKNRIMTIASIHEVLYQDGNLSSISFNNFLQELIDAGAIQNKQHTNDVTINTDTDEFALDINQSIPCGLLLNELLSLIFTFTNKERENNLDICLRKYNSQVHVIIEGENIISCPREMKEHQSLHNILVETLVQQLEGTLLWPNGDEEHQKFELIFTKESSYSPARDLLESNYN